MHHKAFGGRAPDLLGKQLTAHPQTDLGVVPKGERKKEREGEGGQGYPAMAPSGLSMGLAPQPSKIFTT